MNASDLPAALNDIGTELRRCAQGHSHLYDVIAHYEDGRVECSNMLRYLPNRDAHMHRVVAWLRKRGSPVAYIECRPMDSHIRYAYSVRG